MNKAMHVPLLESARDTFLEQMIPHHLNAINMAKLVLKMDPAAGRVIDRIRDLVNTQTFQVHQFRKILEAVGDTHSQCMVNASYLPLTGNQQIATTVVPCSPGVRNVRPKHHQPLHVSRHVRQRDGLL